ncbi:MAG: response regulator transcription factor [Acidobacteria bacterium]|nr:response regulator transcription factor [Acidobacteriota bacterium]
MNVLYVENHPKFSALVGRYLLARHRVVVVPALAAAAAAVSNAVFDVVLLDYDLDDGKGVEIVPLLLSLTPRPKIVAVSAHKSGNDALREAGADAVCYKKDISVIDAVIKSLFDGD